MSFNPAPSAWLGAGYASNATAHTVTMNTDTASSNKTLPALDDAHADPATGDIRQVGLALCDALYQAWLATAQANRPTKMVVQQSKRTNTDGSVSTTYALTFTITPPTPSLLTVVPE